ncbi:MAG TPA: hypothetical protein VFY93_10165 [Planctomycetota bacterium]|nr:hypothetical protein [Planctomycetota bacterium]
MTDEGAEPSAEFVDVGQPLSPAEAGMLEYELEQRGVATRLRICPRGPDGDRQVVQVATADLSVAAAARAEILPARPAPEAPPASRSHRLRNALIAGAIGLIASLRIVRMVHVPKGAMTAFVVLGFAGSVAAAAFSLTKEHPGP